MKKTFFLLAAISVLNFSFASAESALGIIINASNLNPGGDLAFVKSQLDAISVAQEFHDAILQLNPASDLVGISQETFNTTKQFLKTWLKHTTYQKDHYLYQDEKMQCCKIWEMPSIWIDLFSYYGRQERKYGLNGYKANSWGGVFGVESPIVHGLRMGITGNYAYIDLDQDSFKNNSDIHCYQGTIYMNVDVKSCFLDLGFCFGYNRYDTRRHISFEAIDRKAHSKYNGNEYTGFLAAGYQYFWHCFELTPFASVVYSNLHLSRWKEKGAEALNLHIKPQNYQFLESGLGMKLACLFDTCFGKYIPEMHAIWLHDFYTKALKVKARFSERVLTGSSFSNKGPRIYENAWNGGGSLTCIAYDHFSLQIIYDYEGSSSYFDHQGTVKLTYDF